MSITSMIPTIDLAKDSPETQAQLIKHALGSVGFFAVQNAGPSVEDVQAMFDQSQVLFGLDMDEKEKFLAGPSGSGYTKLMSQALGEGKRDHKETFSYGKYCSRVTQNLPPPYSASEEATASLKRFYQACHDVSERLMELFALALELPKEHFRDSHSFGENTAMSLIHYPRLGKEERGALGEMDIRAGEHKDWGTMTLLFQQPNGQPGLQVYLPSNTESSSSIAGNFDETIPLPTDSSRKWKWYPAPIPPPGGFLVNVGLGMELWSGGNYKATLHRVIFPDQPVIEAPSQPNGDNAVSDQEEQEDEGKWGDRYTIGFFVQPDDDVAFQPVLPGGKIDTSVKAITSGELFDMKLKESMNRFKNLSNPVTAQESVSYQVLTT